MKRGLFLLAGLLWWGVAGAQDMILLRNADEIRADVTEITDTEILYKAWGGPDTVLRVPRAEVFSVTYRNGERELFKDDLAVAGATGMTAEYPWPRVTRSYRPGDLFDEDGVRGVVLSVADGGRHGLLLSLEQTRLAWAGETTGLTELYLELSDEVDGWNNRNKLQKWLSVGKLTWTDFPAFEWCEALGAGWYLPAADELKELWSLCGGVTDVEKVRWSDYNAVRKRFNDLSEIHGGEKLPAMLYPLFWSSTETMTTAASACDIGVRPHASWPGGSRIAYFKRHVLLIRAVHKF